MSIDVKQVEREFLDMVPTMRRKARYMWRYMSEDLFNDAFDDLISYCYIEYFKLVQSGRSGNAYATPLAEFSIRHMKEKLKRDALGHAKSLHRNDEHQIVSRDYKKSAHGPHDSWGISCGDWRDIFTVDGRDNPSDTVPTKVDFDAFLDSLTRRLRLIASRLASGDSTKLLASKLALTSGRISQYRRELESIWKSRG
jgi:hypothetical protein